MEPKVKTLYDEMLEVLTKNGKAFDDVLYVAVNEIMDQLTTSKAVEEAKQIFMDNEGTSGKAGGSHYSERGWIAERTTYMIRRGQANGRLKPTRKPSKTTRMCTGRDHCLGLREPGKLPRINGFPSTRIK